MVGQLGRNSLTLVLYVSSSFASPEAAKAAYIKTSYRLIERLLTIGVILSEFRHKPSSVICIVILIN